MTGLLKRVRRNLVAWLALVVAMTGSAYAAASLPAGSVGTKQLLDGAVIESKLHDHSVDAAKLDPASIRGYVRAWASVTQDGQLVASSGGAKVTGTNASFAGGGLTVRWPGQFPRRLGACVPLASAENIGVAQNMPDANYLGKGRVLLYAEGTSTIPEGIAVVLFC